MLRFSSSRRNQYTITKEVLQDFSQTIDIKRPSMGKLNDKKIATYARSALQISSMIHDVLEIS
jgi:hypothetical protein